jgi:hypothetical protein
MTTIETGVGQLVSIWTMSCTDNRRCERSAQSVHSTTAEQVGPAFEAHPRGPAARKSIATGLQQRTGSRPLERAELTRAGTAVRDLLSQRSDVANYLVEGIRRSWLEHTLA